MMSDDDQLPQPRGSVEFVESSILDTIIPSSTGVNIEEALSGTVERFDVGSGSPLSAIAQRQILFFGKFDYHHEQFYVLLIYRS
jgi:hypothetical protein